MADKPYDRILRAAVRLYAREGIQAVGVTRIMAEADVAPTTLYRQFGGKDRLVAAAVRRWGADWLAWLCERMERGGDDPATRLDPLWDALGEWFAGEGFRGSFVANAAAELRGQPEHPVHPVIAEHRAALRRVLEDLAGLAGAADRAATAAQLLVLVDGAVAVATVERSPEAATRAGRLAAALPGSGTEPATPASGAAFCRGRPAGSAGMAVAARTAVLTPSRRRP